MRFDGLAFRLACVAVLSLAAGAASAQQQSQDDKAILDSSSTGTDTGAPPVEDELSTTYSSIGLQKLAFKLPGADVKDAVNLDITMVGFRIPPAPWFAIELNLGFTMIPGQINSSSGGTAGDPFPGCVVTNTCAGGPGSGSQADISATTAGVYGVLRSQGSVFAMGKLGYRYVNTSIEGFPENRSGNAWGAGIGYRWNKKGSYAEFGYTHYTSEITAIGFSLSYSYDRR